MNTPVRQLCVAVWVLTAGMAVAQQQPMRCADQRVTYGPEIEPFIGRIEAISIPPTTADADAEQESEQKTRYFVLQNPDYTKNGPWTTVVWIGEAEKPATVKLEFRDHGNGGVHLQWLNEKLLYGSVWWGRIASTDFIFDVEAKKFLYREMANYADLAQACQP